MTEPLALDPADYDDLVGRISLTSVVAHELHASRTNSSAPMRVDVALESGVAPGEEAVDYRIAMRCNFIGPDDVAVAEVFASILAHYVISEGRALPEVVFHAFGNESATATLWPYLRQHLHDLASRIALPGFTIGLLKHQAQNVDITVTLDVNAEEGLPADR